MPKHSVPVNEMLSKIDNIKFPTISYEEFCDLKQLQEKSDIFRTQVRAFDAVIDDPKIKKSLRKDLLQMYSKAKRHYEEDITRQCNRIEESNNQLLLLNGQRPFNNDFTAFQAHESILQSAVSYLKVQICQAVNSDPSPSSRKRKKNTSGYYKRDWYRNTFETNNNIMNDANASPVISNNNNNNNIVNSAPVSSVNLDRAGVYDILDALFRSATEDSYINNNDVSGYLDVISNNNTTNHSNVNNLDSNISNTNTELGNQPLYASNLYVYDWMLQPQQESLPTTNRDNLFSLIKKREISSVISLLAKYDYNKEEIDQAILLVESPIIKNALVLYQRLFNSPGVVLNGHWTSLIISALSELKAERDSSVIQNSLFKESKDAEILELINFFGRYQNCSIHDLEQRLFTKEFSILNRFINQLKIKDAQTFLGNFVNTTTL